MTNQSLSIGVAVMTYKAKSLLPKCLPPLLASPLKARVLVVNSSSNDGTVELAEQLGAETLVIPRDEFNHGLTRELARKVLGTDIVVMITPDAFPMSSSLIERLTQPIREGVASATYARQIAHEGAEFLESFPREFNYPAHSQVRSLRDIAKYGTYTFFISDSCAAWLNSALDEIGGFDCVLTMEDGVALSKLMHKGHHVAYAADAVVRHSHSYTLLQEFKRYFDTGFQRNRNRNLFLSQARDESHGAGMVKSMFARLTKEKFFLLPYAVLNITAKYLGYLLGMNAKYIPQSLWPRLSGQDFYWTSMAFKDPDLARTKMLERLKRIQDSSTEKPLTFQTKI